MLTDRELLELAAKAAGIKGEWGDSFEIGFTHVDCTDLFFLEDDSNCAIWNPLEDDGDALRLAVKLSIDLEMLLSTVRAKSFFGCTVTEEKGKDALASTRRAIVRAAAEIGRTL